MYNRHARLEGDRGLDSGNTGSRETVPENDRLLESTLAPSGPTF